MKKITYFLFMFIFPFFIQAEEGKILRFKYKENDNFRILSTVNEIVKVNGIPNHKAEIVNRISMKITKVNEDNSAEHEATFMTSENSIGSRTGTNFSWGEEYKSKFTRSKNGNYDIDNIYFMPVVRDVPTFPDYPIKPGDKWTAIGHEAHDLRRTFNISTPYKVPFSAEYTYIKDEEGISSDSSKEKKVFQIINVKYSLFYESPIPNGTTAIDYPQTTMGYSNQTIWWDNEKGQIDHYTENFRILIETVRGNQFDFSGTSRAENTEFKRIATEENLVNVLQKVEDLGLEDISVTKSEKGLTISLENIQFEADSAILRKTEQNKIQKISQILSSYPDNDLLITGHTARVGSEESCQILSEERANAVANFLIQLGVKDKYHIFTQGFGSKIPIASNMNETDKSKNRRVEITILDN